MSLTAPIYPPDEDVAIDGLVDVHSVLHDVVVDLKYSGTDNFVQTDVYGGLRRAFLHPAALEKLVVARRLLAIRDPSLTFVVWDAARPVRAQRILFAHVKGTAEEKYVADPDGRTGSIHSYGCALDLGLVELHSRALVDMGTIYDHFGREAEPREEFALLVEGKAHARAARESTLVARGDGARGVLADRVRVVAHERVRRRDRARALREGRVTRSRRTLSCEGA